MQGKLAMKYGSLATVVMFGGLVWSLLATSLVAAAESDKEEITLSPAVSKIVAQPGQTKKGELTVVNTGETTFSFIVYARPYSVEAQTYSPNYQDTPARSNLYRWVQFDQTEGALGPGESKKIPYTILVPDNAEAGGHYGVLFAETVAPKDSGQVIARNKRVGSIVRLSVGGDLKQSGAVESQSIAWLQTRPPLVAEAVVGNDGNVDFDARTTMRVTTLFGREVFTDTVDYVVYPDKPRHLTTAWEGSPVLGLYRVEQTIDVLGETSQAASYVLMIPRWALMVLVMAAIAGGVYAAYRRLR